MFIRNVLLAILSVLALSSQAAPQTAAAAGQSQTQDQILKVTDSFVRNLFGWGAGFDVKVGPLMPSTSTDFYVVPIHVTVNGQSDAGEVYVSKDGKTLIRGELFDMAADPFAANRSKLRIEGNPSVGSPGAQVTLVEFSDFQCPHCQELRQILKEIEARYKIRLVYKDFPLSQIHPWAQTAAIGARCAFMQSPDAFWKFHDAIFDNQDLISPENVWEKLAGFASQQGLDPEAFKSCMSSPEAAKAVQANRDDGVSLSVTGTPTVFVNGRPVAGGDPAALQQLIEFELAAHSKSAP